MNIRSFYRNFYIVKIEGGKQFNVPDRTFDHGFRRNTLIFIKDIFFK